MIFWQLHYNQINSNSYIETISITLIYFISLYCLCRKYNLMLLFSYILIKIVFKNKHTKLKLHLQLTYLTNNNNSNSLYLLNACNRIFHYYIITLHITCMFKSNDWHSAVLIFLKQP